MNKPTREDVMSGLNAEIKAAIDSLDMDRARELLRDALKDPDAETYFQASKAATDDEQKRAFLHKALEVDPFHENARQALRSEEEQPTSASTSAGPAPGLTDLAYMRQQEDEIRQIRVKIASANSQSAIGWFGLLFGFILAPGGIGILILIGSVFVLWKAHKDKQRLQAELRENLNR